MDTKQQTESANNSLIVPVTHGQVVDIPVAASAVTRYYIQGVDVVLVLKTGEQIVLAGAGPEAFDSARPLQVSFNHEAPMLLKDHLLPNVGEVLVTDQTKTIMPPPDASKDTVELAKLTKNLAQTQQSLKSAQQALNQTQQQLERKEQELEQTEKALATAEKTPAPTPALGELLSAGNSGEDQSASSPQVEQHLLKIDVAPPPPVIPPAGRAGGVPPVDPATQKPEPDVTPTPPKPETPPPIIPLGENKMQITLLATTNTTEANGKLYGPYGGPTADVNPASTIQNAIVKLEAPAGATGRNLVANPGDGSTFTKMLHITMSGAGEAKTLKISGLPPGWSIPGAVRNADGTYTLDLAPYAKGDNKFDIPLQYQLVDPDPNKPIHSSTDVLFEMGIKQGDKNINIDFKQKFILKDVPSGAADQGVYIDPNTDERGLVLPAQGVGYEITTHGNDTVLGGRNDDTIISGTGGNKIDGGGGVNTVSYAKSSAAVNVDLGAGRTTSAGKADDTLTHIQRVEGSDFNDTLKGTTDTKALLGGAGDDTLDPGGATNVAIDGGTGTDTLTFAAATGPVVANLKTGTFSGAGGSGTVVNVEKLIGGSGDDVLTGKTDTLSIMGGAGNDTINPGGATNVAIDGGTGIDTLTFAGASGPVVANLKTGTFSGAGGSGTVANVEKLVGGDGNDTLTGRDTTTMIDGGAGDDVIDPGGATNVAIDGGAGSDTLTFAGVTSPVNVNLRTGTFSGAGGGGTVNNVEKLIGGSGNDVLIGTITTTSIIGGAGDDVIDPGGATNAALDGGAGTDTLSFATTTGPVVANMQTGVFSGGGGNGTAINFERLEGGGGNDTLTGANGILSINGGAGDDTIDPGGATNVAIDGGTGIDTLDFGKATGPVVANLKTGTFSGAGGSGTVANVERLVGGIGNDILTGTTSTLFINGGAGNDTIDPGGATNVAIDGGTGDDTLTFAGTTGPVVVNLKTGVFSGADGSGTVVNVENLIGGSGNDTLTGTTDSKSINAGAGDDIVDPGGATNVALDGGAGTDTLSFAGATGPVVANMQTGVFSGANGAGTAVNFERLVGGAGNDTLTGAAGILSINGGAGDDIINPGGATNIAIDGGVGIDTLTFAGVNGPVVANLKTGVFSGAGGSGTAINMENLIGGNGDDTLTGTTNTQLINGGAGNDNIDPGGATNAAIDGGAGTDTLNMTNATSAVNVDLRAGTYSGGNGAGTVANVEDVVGSRFNDTIRASDAAPSLIDAGEGDDTIIGSTAAKTTLTYARATGGVTLDLLNGKATGAYGNDSFTNVLGFIGSAFNDTVIGLIANATVDGGGGTNTLNLSGMTGPMNVNLGTGAVSGAFGAANALNFQNLLATTAADTIIAGAGANTIDGGGGADTITGNAAGQTTLSFANATTASGVTINLGAGSAPGHASGNASGNYNGAAFSGLNFTNVVGVTGTAGDDTFVTTGLNGVTLNGAGGINTLMMAASTSDLTVNLKTDLLSGAFGSETIYYFQRIVTGSGNDTIIGTNTTTFIDSGAGNDTVDPGGATNAVLNGGLGNDTLTFASATSGVTADMKAGTFSGGGGTGTMSGFENLIGGSGNDTLTGAADTRIINGGAGNDTIDPGGATNVAIDGGTGNNTLDLSHGTGPAQVDLGSGATPGSLNGGAGTGSLANIQNVRGTGFGDTIDGSRQTSDLKLDAGTGSGHANIFGGSGNDMIDVSHVGAGGASVSAGAGNDTIILGGGVVGAMLASPTANVIDGGAGNNTVQFAAGSFTAGSSFSFASLADSIKNVSTLDVAGAGANTYTITTADIHKMAAAGTGDTLTIKTGGSQVNLQLTGTQTSTLSFNNGQYVQTVYSDAAHTNIVAKLILTA